MKPFGRTQWIVIGAAGVIIAAASIGVGLMEAESGKAFLDFLDSFGFKVIATVAGVGGVIKTAGVIKNGKVPK